MKRDRDKTDGNPGPRGSGTDDGSRAVGAAIAAARKRHGFRQKELAYRTGLSQAQLCHLEKGVTRPSAAVVKTIAEALGVPAAELLDPDAAAPVSEVAATRAVPEAAATGGGRQPAPNAVVEPFSGLWQVHAPDETLLTTGLRKAMAKHVREIKALEREAGIPTATTLPLSFPQAMSAASGPYLARCVREACGLGAAAVVEITALLEGKGLRIVRMELPKDVGSWALYDPDDRNAFVFLPTAATDERRRFRLAYELANTIRCATGGFAPVSGRASSRKFSREFAAAFLLPEEAVRETAFQLGTTPKTWTWELLLLAKARFGVSAETFAYRLDEFGLLSRSALREFLRRLHDHYDAHPDAPEPRPPAVDGRLALCRTLAKTRARATEHGRGT